MEIRYPKYYKKFSCIAGQCPDSCCKDWIVGVDAPSAAFYRQLEGPLGDRLRQVLADTEDGTIMENIQGRCPMWQSDGLCRIHTELGHDALCQTCQDFPRLRHDYGSFIEYGLELSCPEAARLILTEADHCWIAESAPAEESCEYDRATMDILLRSRKAFLNFLGTSSLPFSSTLTVLLLYAHQVQEELDGGEAASLEPEHLLNIRLPIQACGDFHALQDFFANLEILTPQWAARLATPPVTPSWENGHKALLHYFLCRYWLQAVSDFDIVCRVKFIIAACLLIGCLGGDLVETAQLFSKEIENDPDNVETILDGAYSAPALTDAALLGLLTVK